MFFGNNNFSVPTLQALLNECNENIFVKRLEVTSILNENNPNPVVEFASSHGIPIHDWPNSIQELRNGFNLAVVSSFGRLLPSEIIQCFNLGVINVHSSLLPKYRGAAPIIHALANGDKILGCSIMQIKAAKFDTGPILLQKPIEIDNSLKLPDVSEILAQMGANLLRQCLENLDFYLSNCRNQERFLVTCAPKITSQFSIVNWQTMTSLQIYNLDRALTGIYALTTQWYNYTIKLYNCQLENCLIDDTKQIQVEPGSFFINETLEKIFILCCDQKFVSFSQMNVNKKKKLTIKDFKNGYLKKGYPKNEKKIHCFSTFHYFK